MVDGPSGILAVSHPDHMPKFEPSKRRVTWPNGARAICISGEEPNRARGLNIDTIWADELPHWEYSQETWDLAMLALRAGSCPRALVTTTPKRVDVLVKLFKEPTTVRTSESTYNNRLHLAEEFVGQIVSMYEGTRLGRQEIYAEMLDLVDGVWVRVVRPKQKHVTEAAAEYLPSSMGRCSSRNRLRNIPNDCRCLFSSPADRSVSQACPRVRRLP